MDLLSLQVQEAKGSFNEYSEFKHLYSLSPSPENETRMKDSLAEFLRDVLSAYKTLHDKTESAVERDLLRQFAGETTLIFK